MQEVTFFGWLIAATIHIYRKQTGTSRPAPNTKKQTKCGGCRR